MTSRAFPRIAAVLGVALAAGLLLASASARTNASLDVGWGGFGNTPDENRHSPLSIIDDGNVDKLGRLYTVNDTGMATCLDAATGKLVWQERIRDTFSASPRSV